MRERRKALGGFTPERRRNAQPVAVPELGTYARFALEGQSRETSTTVAIVRLLGALLKDKAIGPRIVPIVADEARTFGMTALFRQIGIYSPVGQLYEPEDAGSMLSYREARNGQLLEEGITEAGALSSWVAAATSYSTHGLAMLPFYIFYSMFGFQRVGDLIWAAADQRARGFLIGATAGRTTLSGEGLQHQDGTSHVIAATIPNCRAYDPAFAYELAVIFDRGARRMMEEGQDEFYYITMMNENYAQPPMPAGVENDIVKGMYRFETRASGGGGGFVRLLGSGTILREVIEASRLLDADWGVASEVWSVTSYPELARDARAADRLNRLNPARRSDPEPCRRLPARLGPDRRRVRLCLRLPPADRRLCRRPASPRLERTASGAAIRAPRCGPSSRSTVIISRSPRSPPSPREARSRKPRSSRRLRNTGSTPATRRRGRGEGPDDPARPARLPERSAPVAFQSQAPGHTDGSG